MSIILTPEDINRTRVYIVGERDEWRKRNCYDHIEYYCEQMGIDILEYDPDEYEDACPHYYIFPSFTFPGDNFCIFYRYDFKEESCALFVTKQEVLEFFKDKQIESIN